MLQFSLQQNGDKNSTYTYVYLISARQCLRAQILTRQGRAVLSHGTCQAPRTVLTECVLYICYFDYPDCFKGSVDVFNWYFMLATLLDYLGLMRRAEGRLAILAKKVEQEPGC